MDHLFYFLLILLQDFSVYTITEENGSFILSFLTDNGSVVSVFFLPQKITWTYKDNVQIIDDYNTVQYIYYLMTLYDEIWMELITRMLPKPLSVLSKLALPGYVQGESMMRRILTPMKGLLNQIGVDGHGFMMNPDDYALLYKKQMKNCMQETFANEKETIYGHNFQAYGEYSIEMNFFTLPHLLMIEAVLNKNNTWEEMFPDCYFCQVEKYNFVVARHHWESNIFWFAYLDPDIRNLFNHGLELDGFKLTSAVSSNIFDFMIENLDQIGIPKLVNTIYGFEWKMEMHFLPKYFFNRRKIPFQVHSLKKLCKYQLSLTVFLRRLFLFSKYALTLNDINNPDRIERKCDFILELNKSMDFLRNGLYGKEKTLSFKNSTYTYLQHITQEDLDFIWRKGTKFPLETYLDVVQHTDMFRIFGKIQTFEKLLSLKNIFPDFRIKNIKT